MSHQLLRKVLEALLATRPGDSAHTLETSSDLQTVPSSEIADLEALFEARFRTYLLDCTAILGAPDFSAPASPSPSAASGSHALALAYWHAGGKTLYLALEQSSPRGPIAVKLGRVTSGEVKDPA